MTFCLLLVSDLSQKMTAICVIDNAGRRLRIGDFAHNQAHCRIMAQASGIIHRLLLLLRCAPLLFLGAAHPICRLA